MYKTLSVILVLLLNSILVNMNLTEEAEVQEQNLVNLTNTAKDAATQSLSPQLEHGASTLIEITEQYDNSTDISVEEGDLEQVGESVDKAEVDHNLKRIENEHKMIQQSRAVIIRCSRRFTPGFCSQPVTSVWTYVFDQQNCSERLGCPPMERTNSFKTFNRCNRVCMALSSVYSKVLDMGHIGQDVVSEDKTTDLSDLPLSDADSENSDRPIACSNYDKIQRKSQFYEDQWLVSPDLHEFRVDPSVIDNFHNDFNV